MLNWKPALASLTLTLELKDRLDTGLCMSASECQPSGYVQAVRASKQSAASIFPSCVSNNIREKRLPVRLFAISEPASGFNVRFSVGRSSRVETRRVPNAEEE